jgi:serine/threonine-protein kinase
MAPEQAQDFHSADARSDLYSLGCTLYHALAGRSPFAAARPSEMTRLHASEAPPMVDLVVPEIPRGLADVVARLLAKSPDERIQTAGEVDWALQPYVEAGTLDADVAASEWTPEFLVFLHSVGAQPPSASESGRAPSELAPDAAEFLEWLSGQFLEKS